MFEGFFLLLLAIRHELLRSPTIYLLLLQQRFKLPKQPQFLPHTYDDDYYNTYDDSSKIRYIYSLKQSLQTKYRGCL